MGKPGHHFADAFRRHPHFVDQEVHAQLHRLRRKPNEGETASKHLPSGHKRRNEKGGIMIIAETIANRGGN